MLILTIAWDPVGCFFPDRLTLCVLHSFLSPLEGSAYEKSLLKVGADTLDFLETSLYSWEWKKDA